MLHKVLVSLKKWAQLIKVFIVTSHRSYREYQIFLFWSADMVFFLLQASFWGYLMGVSLTFLPFKNSGTFFFA